MDYSAKMNLQKIALCCALTILLSACGGGSGSGSNDQVGTTEGPLDSTGGTTVAAVFPPVYTTPAGVEEYSVEDIKQRVDFDMRDYYIFYDQVPELNLDDYETPEELMRDLRVNPDIFSNVQDAASQLELTEQGRTGAFGFWFRPAGDGVVRFREILFGSPADGAGLVMQRSVRAAPVRVGGGPRDGIGLIGGERLCLQDLVGSTVGVAAGGGGGGRRELLGHDDVQYKLSNSTKMCSRKLVVEIDGLQDSLQSQPP